MNIFGQATYLMIAGLAVVFGTLVLFMGMINLITKLFPDNGDDGEEE